MAIEAGAQPLTDQGAEAEGCRVIWKFPLASADRPIVRVPSGSDFLSVAVQGDDLVAYFVCDLVRRGDLVARRFWVCGTGAEAPSPDSWQFCGTHPIGGLMWHVWLEL